jgi:oligosaccharide repeat unit polymerase
MAGSIAVGTNEIARPRFAPLPFPTSVGILLGIALCAHLGAMVYVLTGAGLAASVFFVGGQFALSLGLLRLYNGVWVFQDIRLPFVVFMFLYGFSLPAISVMRSADSPGLSEAACLYGTAFLGFNIVQWWHKCPWRDVPADSFAWVCPTFANAMLFLAGFAGILGYAWLKGTRTFLTFDRSQMSWLYTQTWVVSMMMMNGFAIFMFAGWPRLGANARRLVAATVIAFVMLHIGLGNRRDFLAMFIFLLGMIASRRMSVIRLRTLAIALVAFLIFVVAGLLRQVQSEPWMLATSDPIGLLADQNEFVMPIQTLTYYASEKRSPLYGMTYFLAPTAFIPRALWPEKPRGLSLQFNKDRFGDVIVPGYAYTPVTEAFINFSIVGPFVVMSLVSLVTVFLVKNARRRPFLYFLCFALALDFNRGESAGVLYSLVVIGVGVGLMKLVSRIEWTPGVLHATWPYVVAGSPDRMKH